MAKNNPEIKIAYSVVNKAFKEGMKENAQESRKLNNELKLTKEEMKHTSSQSEKYEAELSSLNKQLSLASEKSKMTASALENTKEITGENSKETDKWSEALLKAQKNEEFLKNKIIETNAKLDEARQKESEAAKASEKRQQALKGLETQQDSLKTSSERLTKEYELQVAQLGNNAKESDKAKLKQQMLADQMKNSAEQTKNLEQQLKISKQEFGENSTEVHKLQNELLDARVASQEFANAYKDSTNTMKNWGDKLNTYGSQLQDVGKKMTLGVTVPMVAIGGASVKVASDFESAAAGMRKTNDELVDANGKVIISYKDLEDGIRDMSKEIPASAQEIAAVAETAGQLGIQTDAVLSFSRTMIDMGQATNMSSEEAATAMARLANITDMSQKDFDRLGSTIVDLGNHFASTESEITAMGLRLSGVGRQIGMSEADIMGLSAAMSSVGIEAEAGGTAMTMALKKMQNAVAGNTEELQLFAQTAGMSGEEFAKAFNDDPVRALQAYVEGLQKASDSGANLNEVLSDVGINGIREADTMLRLAGNSKLVGEAVDTANNAWEENSALTEEVEKRYETFESKLAILKNQIVDIGIEFGGPLMDALSVVLESLEPVLKTIGDLATKFSEADPKLQQFIITIGLIIAAIGPLVTIIGTIMTLIGGVMTILGTGAAIATGLVIGIPIIIAAIAALVAAVVIYWDDIVAATGKMIDAVKEFFSGIGEWFGEFFGNIKTGWDNWIKSISESMSQIGESIKTKFESVITWFSDLFAKIGEFFGNLKDKFVEKFIEIVENVKQFGSDIIEAVTPFFTRLGEILMVPIDLVKMVFEGLFLFIKAGIDIFVAMMQAFFEQIALFFDEKIKQPIDNFIIFIKQKFDEFMESVSLFFENLWLKVVEVGAKIKQSIIDPVVETVSEVIAKFVELRDRLFGFLGEIVNNIVTKFTEMKDNAVSKFVEMKDAIFGKVSEIVGGISDKFSEAITKTGETFTKIKDAALQPLIDMKNGVKRAIDDIMDFFYNMKLPKFSLKMSSKSFFGKEVSYPSGIDVKWNAKGGIFTQPTIVGSHNGVLQGMGEAGPEAMLPLNDNVLGKIGDGIFNATGEFKRMMDQYVNNFTIQNRIDLTVVSEMDGKSIGYGAANYVDDRFESNGTNAMYGIGRRTR